MKSVERHKLETNVLAHELEVYIERYKPLMSKIGIGLLVVAALFIIWSFIAGSNTAHRNEAWDTFNQAIGAMPMNLDKLKQVAEGYPGTKTQEMADVIWADSQVYVATNSFIYNRTTAKEALARATSTYQKIIQTSDDKPLVARAHLGLARVYEMQNELDKAKAEYKLIGEPYTAVAKAQVERLGLPGTSEAMAWLADAKPLMPSVPMGPGMEGKRPAFSASDISLPSGTEATTPSGQAPASSGSAFDDLLKQMEKDSKSGKDADRYKSDQSPGDKPVGDQPPAASPPASDQNAAKDAAPAGAAPATSTDGKKSDK